MSSDSGAPGSRALLVIDLQRGFEDPSWGPRNNPGCEERVGELVSAWRRRGEPVVFVRHDSATPGSPLAPGSEGNSFKEVLGGAPELLVTKSVHSAFYGRPDLDQWLQQHGVRRLAICGIATDHCCETTARMASDLGYQVDFVLDATHTFDRELPGGATVPAEEIARAAAASLHGEFCRVVETAELT